MAKPVCRKAKPRTYSLDDVVKIKNMAVRWGRAVDIIARDPNGPICEEYLKLLEEMRAYREIFEPMVEESNLELNARYGSNNVKLFDIKIPE